METVSEVVFKITDCQGQVSAGWFSVPLPSGAEYRVRDLPALIKQDFAALGEVGFKLTSLSGSYLLPDTMLKRVPALAVKVSPSAFPSVMDAYKEFEAVQEMDQSPSTSNMLAAQQLVSAVCKAAPIGQLPLSDSAVPIHLTAPNVATSARDDAWLQQNSTSEAEEDFKAARANDQATPNAHEMLALKDQSISTHEIAAANNTNGLQSYSPAWPKYPNLQRFLSPESHDNSNRQVNPKTGEHHQPHQGPPLLHQMAPAANLAAYLMSEAAKAAQYTSLHPAHADAYHHTAEAVDQGEHAVGSQSLSLEQADGHYRRKFGSSQNRLRSQDLPKSKPRFHSPNMGQDRRSSSPSPFKRRKIVWPGDDKSDDRFFRDERGIDSNMSERGGTFNRGRLHTSEQEELENRFGRQDMDGTRRRKCIAPMRPVDASPDRHCLTPNDSLELRSSSGERTGPLTLGRVIELVLESSDAAIQSHALRVTNSGEGRDGGGCGQWFSLSSLVPEIKLWNTLGCIPFFREMYLAKRVALVDFLLQTGVSTDHIDDRMTQDIYKLSNEEVLDVLKSLEKVNFKDIKNPRAYIGSRLHCCLVKPDYHSWKAQKPRSAPYHVGLPPPSAPLSRRAAPEFSGSESDSKKKRSRGTSPRDARGSERMTVANKHASNENRGEQDKHVGHAPNSPRENAGEVEETRTNRDQPNEVLD